MLNIEIILSNVTSDKAKYDAATNIILNYNLPLTQEEILQVFTQVQSDIDKSKFANKYSSLCKYFFNVLLNDNKNMFIAVIKTCIKNNIINFWTLQILIASTDFGYIICGHISHLEYPIAVKMYCEFLDSCDFEVSNLVIEKHYKIKIQRYRHEKYSGKLTKGAIKN